MLDAKYNNKTKCDKENMDKHYHDANEAFNDPKKDTAIPYHDLNIDVKGFLFIIPLTADIAKRATKLTVTS